MVDDHGGCDLPSSSSRHRQYLPDSGADATAGEDLWQDARVASGYDHGLAREEAAARCRRAHGRSRAESQQRYVIEIVFRLAGHSRREDFDDDHLG